MGKIGLQIKANLENVTDVKAQGDDFRWYLKLKCSNCGEESDKWQYVSLEERVPLKSGRGEANLLMKCKLCSRENSLEIDPKSITPYTVDDSNAFKTIVAFECRGVELVSFSPRIGWTAKGAESSTQFKEVNLTENEWVDYDEAAKESVGIYDLEYKFVKI